jgi:hypothetical protein
MGKCKCGEDTGWGGGDRCNLCWEKLKFHFLDKVEVVDGFFKGQKGIIKELIDNSGDGSDDVTLGYKVLLTTGDIVYINKYNLIKKD